MDNSEPEKAQEYLSRERLIRTNAELIDNLQKRVLGVRFRPAPGDSVKLGYIRVLIQALTCMNQILKDTELDEFKKRLEALENSQTSGSNTVSTPVIEAIK